MTPAELSETAHSLSNKHKPSVIRRTPLLKKSTYYYKSVPEHLSVRKKQERILLPLVMDAAEKSRHTYGVVRLTEAVVRSNPGFAVGRNRIRRIMRTHNIHCQTIRRFKPHSRVKTDESGTNLVQRKFSAEKLNSVWVTDITYIHVPGKGFCYLTTFIDLASRKPVGWHFSKDMKTASVLTALKNALNNTGFPKEVIVHSDRGAQFTSNEFRSFLTLMELKQSLSAKGCPYDNAVIESFHSSLKKELVYRTYFLSYEHAKLCLFDYIENFYIRHRLHSALGYITPMEMENRLLLKHPAAA